MQIPILRFDEVLVGKDGRATKPFQQWISAIQSAIGLLPTFRGSGDPNGTVTASPPALYFNNLGGSGNTLWQKTSGTGTDTGWDPIA